MHRKVLLNFTLQQWIKIRLTPQLQNLDRLLENKSRLGIMSILMVNDSVSFGELKELLALSDGNLAAHLKALENENYIFPTKQFIGRKPNTTVSATDKGKNGQI